jgi:hypothetical protein
MEADGDALSGHEIPCSDHAKLNKDGSCKGHPKCAAGLARKEARKTLTKAEAAELRAEKKAAKVAKTALRFTPSARCTPGSANLAQTNFDARYSGF